MKVTKAHRRVLAAAVAVSMFAGVGACSAGGQPADEPVTIYTGFTGAWLEAFQADLDEWSKTSGVKVKADGSVDFLTVIVSMVEGGSPPDIVINPVPTLVQDHIKYLHPTEELGVDIKEASSDLAAGLDTLGVFDGVTYGLPIFANTKSVVWYNPAAFEKAGLAVPTTDAELLALQQKIIDENLGYPWCLGLEAGNSTGWVVTDWVEEYVLRYGGLDQYMQWVNGDVKWSSPLVEQAGQRAAEMLLTPNHVNGGGVAAATTSTEGASLQLWADGGKANGQCFMMRQGQFIIDFFPDDIREQMATNDFTNVNFFQLPPTEGQPVMLGAGDLVAAYSDDDDTKKVVQYLVSKEFGTNGFATKTSGFLSPHKNFDDSKFGSDLQRKLHGLVKDSEVFAFDASDLMPPVIGAGKGLEILTQWFTGELTMQEAFAKIDGLWPAK